MPRKKATAIKTTDNPENIQLQVENPSPSKPEAKKRGRKPKGGKLIEKNPKENNDSNVPTNVILHLKCSLKDIEQTNELSITDPLNYNSSVPPTIKAYDHANENNFFELKSDINNENIQPNAYNEEPSHYVCTKCKQNNVSNKLQIDNDVNMKDINMKLKQLKLSLYKNKMDEKKSACFWCTCDFDNQNFNYNFLLFREKY